MIVYALDTNVIIPRILHPRDHAKPNLLMTMLSMQRRGLIRVAVPKTTQAEVYAVLRAGRYPIRNKENKKVFIPFKHEIIMKLVRRYPEIFDEGFMDSLGGIHFPTEDDAYKPVLFDIIKKVSKMSIKQSKEYLENKHVDLSRCKDEYDYHIMVSAIQVSSTYVVTENQKDFPKTIPGCKIINPKQLFDTFPDNHI